MHLDKANNANPRFGSQLVPVHVWIMQTSHNLDVNEVKTGLSFVPQQILSKMLEAINKTDAKESHLYVVAHDTVADEFKVYLGQAFTSTSDKGFGYSNLIATENDGEGCIQRTKLNELHIQFRPDWSGKREEPKSHDAESYEDMLRWLDENGLKEVFIKVFPLTEENDNPVTALVPSTITKRQVKPPKMTKKRREALVKRFGEENIKKLEERIKKNKDGNNQER